MEMLTQLIHRISNIRPSESAVLKSTHDLSVNSRIGKRTATMPRQFGARRTGRLGGFSSTHVSFSK
jgi:hypothetical protein